MIVGKQYFQIDGLKFVILTIIQLDYARAEYRIDAFHDPAEVGSTGWFYPESGDLLAEVTPLIKAVL